MTKRIVKKMAAVALGLLGVVMIFLGLRAGILAPSVTGLGFFVIAAVFALDS
ncbi:MAG: hypothetical protein RKH07_10840 [Gammaproteobacteria bacterium]